MLNYLASSVISTDGDRLVVTSATGHLVNSSPVKSTLDKTYGQVFLTLINRT